MSGSAQDASKANTSEANDAYWKKNIFLFVFHIGIWTLWTLLIRYSRLTGEENYAFNPVTVILMTEVFKFILSVIFHFSQFRLKNLPFEVINVVEKITLGVYFAAPAAIYCIYNYLFFVNLVFFDPVSYRVLINMRILWSGLLFQLFFKKQLGLWKWIALVLLMIGCAVNQFDSNLNLSVGLIPILSITTQAFVSSLGGVVTEVLVKKNIEVSLNVKNIYLYFFSIIFNTFYLLLTSPSTLHPSVFFDGWRNITWMVAFVGAFCGFSTALFLRYLDIILKEYAHSGEMLLTAFLTFFLFGDSISASVWLSILFVMASISLYNRADK